MDVKGKVTVVTGGASGIGLELCTRFAREGAQVVLSDRDPAAATERASAIGDVLPIQADVSREQDVAGLVDATLDRFGRIDLFCSNAGIVVDGGEQVGLDQWQRVLDVNLLAHVHAAKHVLPHMLQQGSGYLLNTASAAGLLTEFHSAPYTVSKHAAIGFAEWLAITYRDRGIKVSVLCPAGVATPMIANTPSLQQGAITTSQLADDVMSAIAEERFMISTHPFVLKLFAVKGRSFEEYLNIMVGQRDEYTTADIAR